MQVVLLRSHILMNLYLGVSMSLPSLMCVIGFFSVAAHHTKNITCIKRKGGYYTQFNIGNKIPDAKNDEDCANKCFKNPTIL